MDYISKFKDRIEESVRNSLTALYNGFAVYDKDSLKYKHALCGCSGHLYIISEVVYCEHRNVQLGFRGELLYPRFDFLGSAITEIKSVNEVEDTLFFSNFQSLAALYELIKASFLTLEELWKL